MVEKTKKTDYDTYFPQMIEDLIYIWNDLVDDLEECTNQERINNIYDINETIINYFMEIVKVFAKEKYQLEVEYEIDDIKTLGGCAAYDAENNKILISVMGMMLKAINTSSYLQSIFHELEHQRQHEFYREKIQEERQKYPSYFSLIEKHHIFEKSFSQEHPDFYKENYTRLYPEIDAEEESIHMLQELLPTLIQKYQKNNILSEELQSKINVLNKQIIEDIEEIEKDLERNQRIHNKTSEELHNGKEEQSTFIIKNQEVNSQELIDKYFKTYTILPEEKIVLKRIKKKYYNKVRRE